MNFSAEKAPRKWSNGSIWPQRTAMVTAAAGLLALAVQVSPALARKSQNIFGDLFGERPPKLRGSLRATPVPLPKPRPAEAPAKTGKETVKETGNKPQEAGKPATEAAPKHPEPPPPSACRLPLTA